MSIKEYTFFTGPEKFMDVTNYLLFPNYLFPAHSSVPFLSFQNLTTTWSMAKFKFKLMYSKNGPMGNTICHHTT